MALAVYSRVGSLLQAAGMDLEALRHLIAQRYGLAVDQHALTVLAQDGRVEWPDIEVLEAVALILRVRVDDLLDVRPSGPANALPAVSDDALLDPEREARLRDLAAMRDQGDRPLSEAETSELEILIAEMGRALVAREIAAAAQRLGVPVEVARQRITAQATEAGRFWSELESDPERMAAEVAAAKVQRQAQTG